LTCAVLLAYGVSEVAIWFNEMEDGGSLYDSALIHTNPSGGKILADAALYKNNAPPEYFLDDRLAVPADKLICSNFGRYDLIHRIGPGRVDVIPRPMVQISASAWETQRQMPLQDVACVPAQAR
jgi:hypothetical protein